MPLLTILPRPALLVGVALICTSCSTVVGAQDDQSSLPGTAGGVPSTSEEDASLRPTYEELVEYEGTYEFENGLTVQIAASPADTILFALLGGAKYPLTPVGATDTFANVADERVVFTRNDARRITGYRSPGDGSDRVYRLLSAADFPTEMWYPRLAAQRPDYQYQYAVPAASDDGIPVGSIRDTDLDPSPIDAMVQQIIGGAYPDVHSVLIVKSGRLVVEEYFYEYGAETLHQLRSATKSVKSALVGIAIDRGLIEGIDSPVLAYFADEYDSVDNLTAAKERITIGDLLTHRSGLDCDDRNPESPGNEVRMGQTGDWVKFILDLPMTSEPGTEAAYCSGGSAVLGRIVEKAAGVPLEAFAEEHLFGPLGIEDYEWRFEPDSSSSETFTQLYLRPRDMMKFGLLFANGGVRDGRRVISEGWVEASTASHTTVGDTDYGYLWWRPYLNVPGGRHDAVAAQGNGGQEIYLWPELDMVVVLTGGNYNRQSPTNGLFIDYILPPLDGDSDDVPGAPAMTVQGVRGDAVLVENVKVRSNAWIVVHPAAPDGGLDASRVVGHSSVQRGTTDRLLVTLDMGDAASGTFYAMLHDDTGELGRYEFGGAGTPDQPLTKGGAMIIQSFVVE